MKKFEKITILIPCHNEEKGIAKVISGIPYNKLKKQGYSVEVVVIDNNSSDKTNDLAKSAGASVIFENKKGKGNAIKTGFLNLTRDTKYVVMMDGDNTYKAHEITRLIEPLESKFADVIIGSRLSGRMRKNSLRFQNRVANWAYTFLVRQFYKANITDVLSGYFAWKREVIETLHPHLDSEGFEIEMEMITKMVKLKFEIYSVPITYDEREGQTKIEAIKDGIRILHVFFKNLYWSPRKSGKLVPAATS